MQVQGDSEQTFRHHSLWIPRKIFLEVSFLEDHALCKIIETKVRGFCMFVYGQQNPAEPKEQRSYSSGWGHTRSTG